MPVFYECQRCTACCRWPGQVRLSEAEITKIAAFKNLGEFDFIQQFTRLTTDRRGLALMDKPNGECIFLDGNDCAIQSVKPQQCREFPNLWNFPGFEKICKALPKIVGKKEYEDLTKTGKREITDGQSAASETKKRIAAFMPLQLTTESIVPSRSGRRH